MSNEAISHIRHPHGPYLPFGPQTMVSLGNTHAHTRGLKDVRTTLLRKSLAIPHVPAAVVREAAGLIRP